MINKPNIHPIDIKKVAIEDNFWSKRLGLNMEILFYQYDKLEESRAIDNFRVACGLKKGSFTGLWFMDSDVYKWLEASSYTLNYHYNEDLVTKIETVINLLKKVQAEDGYLHTYIMINKCSRYSDLETKHELYNAGHLIEAAVAHYQATGKVNLLQIAVKAADNINQHFIINQHKGVPGHQEIELALYKLYKCTGDARYFELAKYFIDLRGKKEVSFKECPDDMGNKKEHHTPDLMYSQNHVPVTELKEMVGHAVRALYYNCGITDIFLETGESKYRKSLDFMWENMCTKRMHITGGVGSRMAGEAFGMDYELPNEHTYNETCAQVASIFWNSRMFMIEGDAKYQDIIELTLYNSFLSGSSLDGKKYFYANPLKSSGWHERQPWFVCACCPPNMARLIASLGTYIYSISEQGIYINQFIGSRVSYRFPYCGTITLIQQNNYPWDGDINIKVLLEKRCTFSLFIRKPGWLDTFSLGINGKYIKEYTIEKGFIIIKREWNPDDIITYYMDLRPTLLSCHPRIIENQHHVAIKRGPLVYCLEQIDNTDSDLFDIRIDPGEVHIMEEFKADLLHGVTTLSFNACQEKNHTPLYYPYRKLMGRYEKIDVLAIPYYAWNNRNKDKMLVWIPVKV